MRKRGVCFTNKRRKCTRPVGQKLNERGGKQFAASSFVTATGKTASKQRERQILWREDVLIVTVQIKSVLCVSLCLLLCLCVCVCFFFWGKSTLDRCRANICLQQQWLIPTNPSWFRLRLAGCRLGRVRMRWEAECSRQSLFLEVCLFSELLPDSVTDWVESYCHLLLFTSAESSLKCRGGFGRVALFDIKKWRSCSTFQKHHVECFLNVH